MDPITQHMKDNTAITSETTWYAYCISEKKVKKNDKTCVLVI